MEFFRLRGDACRLAWSSLRGGGATFLHQAGVPLDMIRWRGRWGSQRTVEIYVQEVAALSVLRDVPLAARLRIALFAARAVPFIRLVQQRSAGRRMV